MPTHVTQLPVIGVTVDSTLWTADSACWTADGRIICIPAVVAEAASALDVADAVTDVVADAVEAATATDELDAAIGAQVLFGTVDEAADALDALDADVVSVEVPIAVGGGAYYPQRRPFPVIGHGYGILPQLEGEAHGVVGVVGVVGAGAGMLPGIVGEAAGSAGVAGRSAAQLGLIRAAATGVGGNRGSGDGMIVKFSGSATGQHDDDEAAVVAFLLAA